MTTLANWECCQRFPKLTDNEIHIWRASLRGDDRLMRRYENVLASDEKARAARFLVQQAKHDFTAARGILREILSGYTAEEPAEVQLRYGPQGKPYVFTGQAKTCLQFNTSHSCSIGAFAFAKGRQIGIDVEKIRPDFSVEEIAAQYFAEEEAYELQCLPPEERSAAFFRCWTCKEAYVKARGQGLQIPLRAFRVAINNRVQELRDEEGRLWTVCGIDAGEGFTGAIAAEGTNGRISYFDWQPEFSGAQRKLSRESAVARARSG